MSRPGRPTAPRRLLPLVLLVLALSLVGWGARSLSSTDLPSSAGPATALLPTGVDSVVDRVVDGDTLRLSGGHRVRLIGIDAPESVKPHSPIECFGTEASQHLESLLPPGTPVRLVGDVDQRDRYRRLLAYVYRRSDGLFVNLAMAHDGYAQPLTIPPNVAHADHFVAAARQARQANRGLWSACPSSPPPASTRSR